MRWFFTISVLFWTVGTAVSQDVVSGCTEPEIFGKPVVCGDSPATLWIDDACWITWQWSTGATSPAIAVSNSGQVWVEGLYHTGEQVRLTIDVVSVPRPRPTIGNPLEYICEGDVAVLQARDDYLTYRWSTGDSTNTLVITEGGTYWLEVTDTNGCSGFSDQVEVVVVERPDLTIQGPLDVCRDDELEYTTPLIDSASYVWTIDGGTIIGGGTTNTVRVTWQRSGSLQVRAVVQRPDGGSCDSSATIYVQARPRVRPTLTYTRSSFCTGDSITLSLEGTFPSWTWNTGSTQRTITVRNGGLYWVDVVDTNGCPGTTDTLNVLEYPLPVITIDGPPSICGGEPISLMASSANNDVVLWQWNTNATTPLLGVDQPGTYTVVGTTLNGCTDSASVTITEAEPLVVVSSSINFGTVAVGIPQRGIITVENNGPQNITIVNIINTNASVILSPAPPRLVPAGGSETFDVVWTPTTAGALNLPLVFQMVSSNCADTTVSFVRGLARIETIGRVTIAIADTTMEAGRELLLPMTLEVDNPSPVDVRVHIYISAKRDVYDMQSWNLEGSVFGIPTLVGDRVGLDVLWELEPGQSRGVIRAKGTTMLGQPFRTGVVIDSVVVDGGIPFVVDTTHGSVEILGCWLPGRLVEFSDAAFTRRYFTIDGREVFDPQRCRPCLEVLQDMNGMVIRTYLTNNISR